MMARTRPEAHSSYANHGDARKATKCHYAQACQPRETDQRGIADAGSRPRCACEAQEGQVLQVKRRQVAVA